MAPEVITQVDGEIIWASWRKAVGVWAVALVAVLIGAVFLIFRWNLFGFPWYWIGGTAIVAGMVVVVVWDGLVPFRKRRLVIGSDCFQIAEIGNRVIVHIPFTNIEGFRVADHYDKDNDLRIPNHYLIVTVKDAKDVNTRASFRTDEETHRSYLQLQDSYVESLPEVLKRAEGRFHAYSEKAANNLEKRDRMPS